MRAGMMLLSLILFALISAAVPEPSIELILYAAMRPADWDIFLQDTPGKTAKRLTTDPSLDYNAVFSPDEKWIVFCSERNGNPDLFALDPSDPAKQFALTQTVEMEDAPAFSPDGRTLAFVGTRDGNADIFVMPFHPDRPAEAPEIRNLTQNPAGEFNPAFSPDGKQIAFSSNRSGSGSDILLMNTDGTSVRALTDNQGWDGSPAWAPDGKTIYFYSNRSNGLRIWRMSPDGSQQVPVTDSTFEALSPAVSSAGRVAFSAARGEHTRIESMKTNGSDIRVESAQAGHFLAPSFGSRSGRIVFHGTESSGRIPGDDTFEPFVVAGKPELVPLPDRSLELHPLRGYFPSHNTIGKEVVSSNMFSRIMVSALDGTHMRDVYRGSAWGPRWSADGKFIFFSVGPTFAGAGASVDIYRSRGDGTEAVNLTKDSMQNDAFPDVAANGVVFRSGRDGNHEIYWMDFDGNKVRRLTNESATDTMPAISPKGDLVAFTSSRTGDYELYLLRLSADGSAGEPERLTDSPGFDMHPKFSPDGEWLVFASQRGGINDEEPLNPIYNPQPYGDIWTMRIKDRAVFRLTHNKWEDGTPSWSKP